MYVCVYVYTAGVDGESTLVHLLNAKISYSEWKNDSNGFANLQQIHVFLQGKTHGFLVWAARSEAMVTWDIFHHPIETGNSKPTTYQPKHHLESQKKSNSQLPSGNLT